MDRKGKRAGEELSPETEPIQEMMMRQTLLGIPSLASFGNSVFCVAAPACKLSAVGSSPA